MRAFVSAIQTGPTPLCGSLTWQAKWRIHHRWVLSMCWSDRRQRHPSSQRQRYPAQNSDQEPLGMN